MKLCICNFHVRLSVCSWTQFCPELPLLNHSPFCDQNLVGGMITFSDNSSYFCYRQHTSLLFLDPELFPTRQHSQTCQILSHLQVAFGKVKTLLNEEEKATYRNEQFLLFPQFFSIQSDNCTPFVHIFDIKSLFDAELEDPKLGI